MVNLYFKGKSAAKYFGKEKKEKKNQKKNDEVVVESENKWQIGSGQWRRYRDTPS